MRTVDEWQPKTDDAAIPDRVKLRVFARCNGRCRECTRKCGVGGEPFQCDHIVALVNGGKHAESNLQLLCITCHAIKTKADVGEKSRVYKRRKSNAGIKKQRSIRSWRRFNGEIVYAERERQ